MGDQKVKKENAVKRIEKLSAIFSAAAIIPALRALHTRRIFMATPEIFKTHELPASHALSLQVKELVDSLNVNTRVEMTDAHIPLYGAFTYPMERRNTIGDITKVCIVFLGNPSLSPHPDTLSRAVIAHELAHIKQMNGAFYACDRANMHTALAVTIASAAIAIFNPAFFPITFSSAILLAGLKALCQIETRYNEFLADLRGAEIINSQDDMILSLSYFERLQENWQASENKSVKTHSVIMRMFNSNAFLSHPPFKKRIAALKAQKEYHARANNLIPHPPPERTY